MRSTPLKVALLVAAIGFLAYVPVLDGDFIELDDDRFVRDNPAVQHLDPGQVARYFTDPRSIGIRGWQGIYRPLRTLDFALDWALSGGRPWFFHLRNVLYHVLGALLVLALFRRLSGGEGAGAAPVLGALLFAAHPVQTEAVAWITSRGDVLLLVTFLLALLLHLSGRRIAAALVLVISLFSKEGAAVFPAVALLVDLYRRERLRWRWYGLYAALVGAFAVLWLSVQERFGHVPAWWGGSYGANLLTMARGLLLYASLVVVPVRQVLDHFIPAKTGFDLGAALGILIVLLAVVGAWRGGRRVRFAAAWFAVTILPVANLLYTVATPVTDRFLYLPMVGICFLAGHLLARSRLALVPVGCLFVLTFSRAGDWRDHDRLMAATRAVATTRVGHVHLIEMEFEAALEARSRGDREALLLHAKTVVETTDELRDYLWSRVGADPPGRTLVRKAEALYIAGRPEALAASLEAVVYLKGAVEAGYDVTDLLPDGARLLNAAARDREAAGDRETARELYRRSLELLPDPLTNAEARIDPEIEAAGEALERGDREGLVRHAMAAIRAVDVASGRSGRGDLGLPRTRLLEKKAFALDLMGRREAALRVAEEYIARGGGASAHFCAGAALDRLGRTEEAADHMEKAIAMGFAEFDLRPVGARLLNAAAGKREAAGERGAARDLYRRSLRLVPEARGNAEAGEGLRRLDR